MNRKVNMTDRMKRKSRARMTSFTFPQGRRQGQHFNKNEASIHLWISQYTSRLFKRLGTYIKPFKVIHAPSAKRLAACMYTIYSCSIHDLALSVIQIWPSTSKRYTSISTRINFPSEMKKGDATNLLWT